ncbi:MAG TPA: hypothetical protein VFN59_09310 [Acidimicrobiales bacterium]|nr:hypothetical protein [Acidimicrobiales bacterium]
MVSELPTGPTLARRALASVAPSGVLESVDALDLRPSGTLNPVVAMPLRELARTRDVVAFAARAPSAAVRALVELLSLGPLERVVERLGESADDPTYDELCDALAGLADEGMTRDERLLVLTFAVEEGFAAAPHCRRLLEEDPALVLTDLPETLAPGVARPAPRVVDDAVRERRRERRAAQRERRASSPSRPSRPRARPASPRPSPLPGEPPRRIPEPVVRRAVRLTPLEASRFDTAHPLAGAVVVLEVPFDASDPDAPDVTAKVRPALVVAGAPEALLVRALYSHDAPTRQPFGPWRRVGLDHPSYIDDARVAIPLTGPAPSPLGRLSDEEWNALSH